MLCGTPHPLVVSCALWSLLWNLSFPTNRLPERLELRKWFSECRTLYCVSSLRRLRRFIGLRLPHTEQMNQRGKWKEFASPVHWPVPPGVMVLVTQRPNTSFLSAGGKKVDGAKLNCTLDCTSLCYLPGFLKSSFITHRPFKRKRESGRA